MPITAAQITTLKDNAKKLGKDGEQAVEMHELALLGLWARDSVQPLLRKLPDGEMKLPAEKGNEPIVTTIRAEVEKVFRACPQPEIK